MTELSAQHPPLTTRHSRTPLEGVRVLDLTRVLAGPFCTMVLGDLGADVIKVEQPAKGDDTRQWGPPFVGGESAYYLAINRNKRSLTLNLKHPRGRELLRELAERSDVLVENFKAGDLDRIGVGYDQLRQLNPGLIYCSITGFGPDGPYRQWPGYDFITQAMGGLMSITGEPDGEPMKVGVAITDLVSGLYASTSILAALHHRTQTGLGQRVDLSLLESTVACLINVGSNYLVAGQESRRYGNAHPSIVPYQVFNARDKPFVVGAGNDGQFRRLCQAIEREGLAEDVRFATNQRRVENRDLLVGILSEVFGQRDAAEWVERLLAAGVPCGPINTVSEVFSDPQVLHRQMVAEVPHPTIGSLRLAGIPFKLSEAPPSLRRHPPLLGEHTQEVLSETLGLSSPEIEALRAEGVI